MDKSLPKTTSEFELFKKAMDNVIIDPYQTARETTNAMAADYMAELKKCLENHKSLDRPYVIDAYSRRDLPIERCLHTTFIARRTFPDPEWQHTVYLIDNKAGTVSLIWALPTEADAKQIVKRPDLFDSKLVEDCNLMLNNKELTLESFRRTEVKI